MGLGALPVDCWRTDWRRTIWFWVGRGVHRALLAMSDGRLVVKALRPACWTCDSTLAAARGLIAGAIGKSRETVARGHRVNCRMRRG